MEAIYLILGILLLLITLYDFFYTTLSGGGAAIITRFVTYISHKCLQLCVKQFGRRVYNLSGMAVNLSVLLVWVALIWIGLYLVFSTNPHAIVNNEGHMANNWERLYFTGYILSTLGIGNFYPTTAAFELLTSIFSFFGFIFFTTSMTYLISVSSAVIHKRALALSIRNLGKTPEEMVYRLLNQDTAFSRQNLSSLQEKIERHSINLHAYPVLHNYANSEIPSSLSLNIVTLDEALSILMNSKEGEIIKNALAAIRGSVTYYLNHVETNFSRTLLKKEGPDIHKLRGWEIISSSFIDDPSLYNRRKVLGGILQTESFEWQDVYQANVSN
jgi:hypothetical protein